MADLEGQPRTAGVQTAVEDEGAADAAVARGHAEQMLGSAAGAVPVLGERGEVDIVSGERGAGDARFTDTRGEDLTDLGACRPGDVQWVERGALRFGHGGGDGEARTDAAQPTVAQQPGACVDDFTHDLGRVRCDGDTAGSRGDEPAAEPHQRGTEPVGMHLRGDGDRAGLADRQPVRGAALRACRGTGAGVDADETERLQLGGDRTGGRAGDAELGGEHGAGGRASGVDQLQGGPERAPAPLQLRPGGGRLAVHGGESPMIRSDRRRSGRAPLPACCHDGRRFGPRRPPLPVTVVTPSRHCHRSSRSP